MTLLIAGIRFGTYAQDVKPARKERPQYENLDQDKEEVLLLKNVQRFTQNVCKKILI